MELSGRVEGLSDAACEVWDAVVAGGWSPSCASDTLATVDLLVAALARIGPEVEEALATVRSATAQARTLIKESEDTRRTTARAAPARTSPGSAGRHAVPEFWISRNAVVAEQLWWGAQEGRGGPLADMFAGLPPRAMEEAVRRRRHGEAWHAVLEDLTRRHAR